MSITWIGLVELLIGGLLLFRGGLAPMLAFLMGAYLFGGSAAILLPALGGSSIPPAYVALGFLWLQIMKRGRGVMPVLGDALQANFAFVFFCLYGALTALILPRLFAERFEVVSIRGGDIHHLFDTVPLRFSNQNLTTAVYLVGSLLGAMAASLVAATRRGAEAVFRILLGVTWGHVALGGGVLALQLAGQDALIALVRNGAYAQLDDAYRGFVRLTGFFPEASSYAGFGFPLLVFATEAWLRDVRPRVSGPTAIAAWLVMVLSTSGSAYVSLAVYVAILAARWFSAPGSIRGDKAVKVLALAVVCLCLALAAMASSSKVLSGFGDMLGHMTLDKAQSSSGQQRRFWAEQGLHLFQGSWGLGVGAGSFRSSSLITAVAGSMGAVGLAAFLAYLFAVFQPLRPGSYLSRPGADHEVGAACAWAAVVGLLPAMVAAPSPDPGLQFAVLAGAALSLRTLAERAPEPAARPARPIPPRAAPSPVAGAKT